MVGKKSRKTGLTQTTIRGYVGVQSFERGMDYYNNGYISDGRVSEDTIRARSEGQSGGPYRVSATISDGDILDSDCSCPIGGACKHVAAMLLLWTNSPDEFGVAKDMHATLAKRSKEELLALVEHMLDVEPDLEDLLDMPLPVKQKSADKKTATKNEPVKKNIKLDPTPYERQASSAFRAASRRYGWSYDVASNLDGIVDLGQRFLKEKGFVQAASVFQGVAQGILAHTEEAGSDEEGEILNVVGECAEGINACLKTITDAKMRQSLFETLFEMILGDIELGGVDMDGNAQDYLLKQSNPDEKKMLAKRVQQELDRTPSKNESSRRERNRLSGLLLELEAQTLDDEQYLKICRENGRTDDLIERLLKLKRVDEALAEAKLFEAPALIRAADIFSQRKKLELLEPVLVAREAQPSKVFGANTRLSEWLRDYYQEQKQWDKALGYTVKLFRHHPSLKRFQEAELLAGRLKQWKQTRQVLMDHATLSKDETLLANIYLYEKNPDAAIQAVSNVSINHMGYNGDIRLTVATAVKKTHPRFAIEVYREQAERIIKQRARGSYTTACQYLQTVKTLYAGLGEAHVWEAYFANVQESVKPLSAFRDELRRVKLV